MTAKAMTAARKTPSWQLRARRVQAQLTKMAERKAASYSPEAKRRFYPFVLGPVSRLGLRFLQDELLPLAPDGKTANERRLIKQLESMRAKQKIIQERIERVCHEPLATRGTRRRRVK